MKTFSKFKNELIENTKSKYTADMKYFKNAVDKNIHTKNMYEKFKLETWGFSYTFDGYMTGGFYYDGGKVYDLQDVDPEEAPKKFKKFRSYKNIKLATKASIDSMNPDNYN